MESSHNIRSDRDILEEILLLSRQKLHAANSERRLPIKLIKDFMHNLDKIRLVNETAISAPVNDSLKMLVNGTYYMLRFTDSDEIDEIEQALKELKSKLENFIPF